MRGLPIWMDLVQGRALVAGTAIAISESGANGGLRIGGAQGPVLRALTFAERSRTVERSAASPQPREAVSAAILAAATLEPGIADTTIQEILAMYLAGAGQPAPAFAEAALLVGRTAGWSYSELAEAEAAAVDRLASHIAGSHDGVHWNQILITDAAPDQLEMVRLELADDLLGRLGSVDKEDAATFSAQPEEFEEKDERHESWGAGPVSPPRSPVDQPALPRNPDAAPWQVVPVRNEDRPVWTSGPHVERAPSPAAGPSFDSALAAAEPAPVISAPVTSGWSHPEIRPAHRISWKLTEPGGIDMGAPTPILELQSFGSAQAEYRGAPEIAASAPSNCNPVLPKTVAGGFSQPLIRSDNLTPDAREFFTPSLTLEALAAMLHEEADLRGIDR